MKKGLKLFISFCLIVPLFFSFNALRSEAATCQQTSIGIKCDNSIAAEHNVKIYYTKSEVNKIVKRYNDLSSNKSLIVAYILGVKSPPIGLSVLFYQIGYNNVIPQFKTAKSKGTGLEVSYKVTVYKGSNALTKVSGIKYKYR